MLVWDDAFLHFLFFAILQGLCVSLKQYCVFALDEHLGSRKCLA